RASVWLTQCHEGPDPADHTEACHGGECHLPGVHGSADLSIGVIGVSVLDVIGQQIRRHKGPQTQRQGEDETKHSQDPGSSEGRHRHERTLLSGVEVDDRGTTVAVNTAAMRRRPAARASPREYPLASAEAEVEPLIRASEAVPRTASPNEAPICLEAFSNAEAAPLWLAGTPIVAVETTGPRHRPKPTLATREGPRTSAANVPLASIKENQANPAADTMAPPISSVRAGSRYPSLMARTEPATTPRANGRNSTPARAAPCPRTSWR